MKINLFDFLPSPEELAKTVDLNLLEVQIFGEDIQNEMKNEYPKGNVGSNYSSEPPLNSTTLIEVGLYLAKSKEQTIRHVNKRWSFNLKNKPMLSDIKGEFQTC